MDTGGRLCNDILSDLKKHGSEEHKYRFENEYAFHFLVHLQVINDYQFIITYTLGRKGTSTESHFSCA